ncbi:hypothetical protein B0J15DRAFT_461833 [Fusarium solani]|uniref:Uncharacterized protein n=1 Tax=Fusarium solani TaxID=169388 RepID=A0A9P9L0L5_FUSSL|nr:uncharacterized protein B0J15DRAFT_461833 [Fusarium solani]KAH7271819.1 hypothetical protein B0J15DRAFT_461833 [Fusarium solani]
MVQFEEKDMVRSKEKEMVERMCHPPSNPTISEPTLRRRETVWERVLGNFVNALLRVIGVAIFLLSIGLFFMAVQEPEGEKRKELGRASGLSFGTAIVIWKSVCQAEEFRRQRFQADLEAGSISNEIPLIDIES